MRLLKVQVHSTWLLWHPDCVNSGMLTTYQLVGFHHHPLYIIVYCLIYLFDEMWHASKVAAGLPLVTISHDMFPQFAWCFFRSTAFLGNIIWSGETPRQERKKIGMDELCSPRSFLFTLKSLLPSAGCSSPHSEWFRLVSTTTTTTVNTMCKVTIAVQASSTSSSSSSPPPYGKKTTLMIAIFLRRGVCSKLNGHLLQQAPWKRLSHRNTLVYK